MLLFVGFFLIFVVFELLFLRQSLRAASVFVSGHIFYFVRLC